MGSKNAINTLHFGLIGEKLEHSFSKSYFDAHFSTLYQVPATYANFEIPHKDGLKTFCQTKALELQGFNVTIPYKESIIPFLDVIDPDAQNIGAVNTVKQTNGILTGYNTDWIGFKTMLQPYLRVKTHKALILGTGGASKAVAYACRQLDIPFRFVSSSDKRYWSYKDVDSSVLSTYNIIINTTPLGMYPKTDTCPDIPYGAINDSHTVVDLIYNPSLTLFLSRAADQGATIINGQKMLEIQAEKAWKLWLS